MKDLIKEILPETFYADMCSEDRLRMMVKHWNRAIKINQELEEKISNLTEPKYTDTWQLCPKCNGQSYVSKPAHVQGDQQYWSDTSTSHLCDVCNGNKIIQRYNSSLIKR